MREKYLKDLSKIVKGNDEAKTKMEILHFKIEEIDEEGNKINYTEGETNEMLAKKDEAAMRLTASLQIEMDALLQGTGYANAR